MSKRWVLVFLVFSIFIVCASIAGCKKDKDPVIVQPDVSGTHYYAAGVHGDLVNAQVNVASEVYSFLQLEGSSPIGVGTGSYSPATGLGTYAYYDDEDNTMWALNPDKFIAMGGDDYIMLGVPVYSGTYPTTVIAGMYNYLNFEYDSDLDEYEADYGTLEIDAAGTWKIYESIDGTTYPASNTDSGTWTDHGNGRVSIMVDSLGGARIGNISIFPSVNGNILVMNYAVMGSYGLIVGLTQASITSGDLDGTYDSIEWDATVFTEIVLSGTNITIGAGSPQTITLNDPWDGMISGSDFYVIGTQDGLAVTIVVNIGSDDDMIMNVKR